ncbi:hypothetical protein HGO75_04895 [Mycobacterium tuberculosis]|nr:hypothetical protein [Mycobacterium tuberculosis]NLP95503.1 hypothetical protein [Mycobacterium tuberculosis]NLP95755.1 hypothetical protein [Mycobacterium tuberculosis]
MFDHVIPTRCCGFAAGASHRYSVRLRPHPRPRVRDRALRRALGVGGMSSAVSTGAFLTTVCLAHLVLGALMGVLVHEFGADMLSLWPVGPALCH